MMILSVVAMRGWQISIAAPYSTVWGNASFIVLGCFIFILWLVVGVVVFVAGEDLTPPPFFIIFCKHGGIGLSPRLVYLFLNGEFALKS